ncbi:MAG: GerMN domain-containing protein [Clostridiales Family XIII bacterium]|jgi:hypothetical protein|nr:GerMN domain-containing protein [Clostridiales Family XIII bacterium]
MSKIKSIVAFSLVLAMILGAGVGAAGCRKDTDSGRSGKVYKMQLYFANLDFIDSGDEALGHLTGPFEMNISSDDKEGYDKYSLLLECLKSPPEEGDGNSANMISDQIRFGGVTLDGGVATVDVKSETASGEALYGGTLEELLFIEQITFSMIDSFEEVEEVAFTVDGNKADTLMGQMDIREPFNKESFDGGQ